MADLDKLLIKIESDQKPSFGTEEKKKLNSVFAQYFKKGKDSKELEEQIGGERLATLRKYFESANWDYYAVVPLFEFSEEMVNSALQLVFENYILVNNSHNPLCPKIKGLKKEETTNLAMVLSLITDYHISRNIGKYAIASVLCDYYDLPKSCSDIFAEMVMKHKEELQRIFILKRLSEIDFRRK